MLSVPENPSTPIFTRLGSAQGNFRLRDLCWVYRKLSAAITSAGVGRFQISHFGHGEHRKSFRMSPLGASGDHLSGTFAAGRVLLDHHLGPRVILGRAYRPARLCGS